MKKHQLNSESDYEDATGNDVELTDGQRLSLILLGFAIVFILYCIYCYYLPI